MVVVSDVGSIDVLLEEIRIALDTQRRFFEGLDAKAGILLGFAGTLAALARPAGTALAVAGSAFAAARVMPHKWLRLRIAMGLMLGVDAVVRWLI